MLADFPEPENGCEIALFADDVAIYYTAESKEATIGFPQHLMKKRRMDDRLELRIFIGQICLDALLEKKRQMQNTASI